MESQVYFFGCRLNDGGHYWHTSDTKTEYYTNPLFEGFYPPGIDGGFCHNEQKLGGQREGLAKVTYIDGHTVIAWWDRSGDNGGNSNAACIITNMKVDFEQGIELGKIHFPKLFERMKYEIKEVIL